MNEQSKQALGKAAPWIGIGLALVIGFAMGGWLVGGGEADSHRGHQHGAKDENTIWTCSMHPQIRQPEPGQCPICGMDLIPVNQTGQDSTKPEEIVFSERARIKAQIRTAAVKRLGAGGVDRHLLGRVDYDETTLRTVTSWIGGRIDKLHVRVTGQRVGRGQVIATLYSPEVYSAHQDLIQAKKQRSRLMAGATASAQSAADFGLTAARERLRLLGVPSAELSKMEDAKTPREHIRIRTPFGGTVIERLATEGNYVKTGAGLYRIADLSRLWVQLDAYESDLSILKVGQEVSLQV